MSLLFFATPCTRFASPNLTRRAVTCGVSPPPNRETETENPVKPAVKPAEPAAPAVEPKKHPASQDLFGALAERTVETAEEIRLHYTRLFRNPEKPYKPVTKRPRVVVLGSGWAAHSFIKVIDEEQYEVSLVSPRNYYFFTPLLAATAVGTIEFRSVVDPIRHANQYINYYEAECTEIDVARSEIVCTPKEETPLPYGHARPLPVSANGANATASSEQASAAMLARRPFRLGYDYLLVAVGETVGTFGVPGVKEHAHFLKEILDSLRLRRAILRAFESASLPTLSEEERRKMIRFVVVGGGPTGCEFAGELSDFVINDLRKRYPDVAPLANVTLLQSGDSILTQFEKSLQQRALSNFANQKVDIMLNARVVNVSDTHVELKDGRKIPYGLLVWAAGNSPRAITSKLINSINDAHSSISNPSHGNGAEDGTAALPQPFRRKLTVDPWLRVAGTENVFALGDCSLVDGAPLPATAQVAGQQGAYLARALRKLAREKEDEKKQWEEITRPFKFLSLGIMSYIGNDKAILQVDTKFSKMGSVQLSGFVSYLLWASTYAVKQVDTRNRMLVLFDWFKTRVFGRDISQF